MVAKRCDRRVRRRRRREWKERLEMTCWVGVRCRAVVEDGMQWRYECVLTGGRIAVLTTWERIGAAEQWGAIAINALVRVR